MVFAESSARWILVLHTVAAVACVAASTHLVIWLRGYRRGSFTRTHAVRRFAWIAVALYGAAFIGGNLIYPTYKVRVRAQFLEDPSEITREAAARAISARRTERVYGGGRAAAEVDVTPTETPARNAAKIARWFDTKEHWVALGFALAFGVALMLHAWNPKRDPPVLGPIIFWLAVASASAAWLGAIVGVVTSSYRAVGGL